MWCLSQTDSLVGPAKIFERVKCRGVYQFRGSEDDLFDENELTKLQNTLKGMRVTNKICIVPEEGHAFDVFEDCKPYHRAVEFCLEVINA